MRYVFLLIPFLAACADYVPAPKTLRVENGKVVIPTPCPDWRHSPMFNHDNGKMSNYGCATVHNFGKQLADPNDLVAPEPSDGKATTTTSIRAIERLNSGEFIRPISAAPTR